MKKLIFALTFIMFISCYVFAEKEVKDVPLKVYINGEYKTLQPEAFTRGAKAYVPMKALADIFKAQIKYDKNKKTYSITYGNKKTTFSQSQVLIINGTGFLSYDLMAVALNYNAKWDEDANRIRMDKKPKEEAPAPCPPAGGG